MPHSLPTKENNIALNMKKSWQIHCTCYVLIWQRIEKLLFSFFFRLLDFSILDSFSWKLQPRELYELFIISIYEFWHNSFRNPEMENCLLNIFRSQSDKFLSFWATHTSSAAQYSGSLWVKLIDGTTYIYTYYANEVCYFTDTFANKIILRNCDSWQKACN